MAAKSDEQQMIYCRNGVMIAQHAASQNIDPVTAYGPGTTAMMESESFVYEERIGDPPPDGQPDTRPFKCPF